MFLSNGFFFLVFLSIFPQIIDSYSCIDENGNEVDSWVALKASASSIYYVYDEPSKLFLQSPYNLSQSSNGCIMKTVNQLYNIPKSKTDYAFGVWNDQPATPSTAPSAFAHSKGVLMSDSTKGFWFVHSMPQWPPLKPPFPLPDLTYGQSFSCVTVAPSVANTIASNLIIDRTYIYFSNITASATTQMPQVSQWLAKTRTSITNRTTVFQSFYNKTYIQFAKSGSWGKDLYDDLVSPYFKTPLNVETWRNGAGGRMSSICGSTPLTPYNASSIDEYDIYQVKGVRMSNGVSWTGTQDHSKWCSATSSPSTASLLAPSSSSTPSSSSASVTCVGDMNRMCSQESRGGGALCTKDSSLWYAFNSTISGFEGCFQYNPCTAGSTLCYWCPSLAPSPSPSTSTSRIPTSTTTSTPTRTPTAASIVSAPSLVPSFPPTIAPTTAAATISSTPTVMPTITIAPINPTIIVPSLEPTITAGPRPTIIPFSFSSPSPSSSSSSSSSPSIAPTPTADSNNNINTNSNDGNKGNSLTGNLNSPYVLAGVVIVGILVATIAMVAIAKIFRIFSSCKGDSFRESLFEKGDDNNSNNSSSSNYNGTGKRTLSTSNNGNGNGNSNSNSNSNSNGDVDNDIVMERVYSRSRSVFNSVDKNFSPASSDINYL